MTCAKFDKDALNTPSQLRIVRSGLHLVTYLDVGNFCGKNADTTLEEVCVQVFLRFSDSAGQANPYH